MLSSFVDVLQPLFSRVLASAVGALVTYLSAHGIALAAQTTQQVQSAALALSLALFGVVYAIVHKVVDKLINPADAAVGGVKV